MKFQINSFNRNFEEKKLISNIAVIYFVKAFKAFKATFSVPRIPHSNLRIAITSGYGIDLVEV